VDGRGDTARVAGAIRVRVLVGRAADRTGPAPWGLPSQGAGPSPLPGRFGRA